jgi:hypothetical protein
MKFLSILTVLVFIVAISQATPIVKRKLGSEVVTQGVRFEGLYKKFNSQVKGVNKKFDKKIASFNEAIPKIAKEDGTDEEDVKWLLDWNDKYAKLVGELKTTSGKLDTSISNLGKRLRSK